MSLKQILEEAETPLRTATLGINVVRYQRTNKSAINVHVNGLPEESFEVDGLLTLGEALLVVGAQLRLEGK
jgi:hypothetical protein